eukprot:4408454-Pyramimonas_sp.AAC.1
MSRARGSFSTYSKVDHSCRHVFFSRRACLRRKAHSRTSGKLVTSHIRRMSQAKRLFPKELLLVKSWFGEDVPGEIVILGRLESVI